MSLIVMSVAALALPQAPQPIQPDLCRLAGGKEAQVFNRKLTVAPEDGRAVARLDARAGDGGLGFDSVQLGEGAIELEVQRLRAKSM